MIIKRTLIYLFLLSLLSGSVLWAGEGQLDNMFDVNINHESVVYNDVLNHVVDGHHAEHDCHISAHLVGLNSSSLIFSNFGTRPSLTAYTLQFTSYKIPPPNKPPRA